MPRHDLGHAHIRPVLFLGLLLAIAGFLAQARATAEPVIPTPVNSRPAMPGDLDLDGDVDADDAAALADCTTGPGIAPLPGCALGDLDQDNDVDLHDWAVFALHFTGPFADCNSNGVPDDQDIATGTSQDCNTNGVPDECDIAAGTSDDCNTNGVPDECELQSYTDPCMFPVTLVANTTPAMDNVYVGPPDDIYGSLHEEYIIYDFDCALIVDEAGPDLNVYEVDWGLEEFVLLDVLVSADGVSFTSIKASEGPVVRMPGDEAHGDDQYARSYDLAGSGLATARFVKLQGVNAQGANGFDPDAIGLIHAQGLLVNHDCNGNGQLDECDIAAGTSEDCNANGVPDECDIAAGTSSDANGNGIPDECEFADCNSNGVPDDQDIATGTSQDCNTNAIPDECDIAAGTSNDCNSNGVPDECDIAGSAAIHPHLLHRYSFAADARDSIGDADGMLMDGAMVQDGAVVLDGVDDYVRLPIGATIGGLGSITLEAWLEWNGGPDWQRVFDIGTDTINYMFLTPRTVGTNGVARFAIRTPTVGEQQVSAAAPPTNTLVHLAVTLDATAQKAVLYIDGVWVNESPNVTLTPADLGTNCVGYLGKSFWPDPYLNGRITEFRIYGAALTGGEIATSFADGPDAHEATYSQDCNTNGIPDECDIAAGTSADCNTNSIPDECDIASGTSEDCQPNGVPDECDIMPGLLHPALLHRYSFTADAHDSVGGADGTLCSGASIVNEAVALDGVDDYVSLPLGASMAGLTSFTLESWLVFNQGVNSPRLFECGADTDHYLFLTPKKGGWPAPPQYWITIGMGIHGVAEAANMFPQSSAAHLALAYDAPTQTAQLYINGVPDGAGATISLTPADLGTNLQCFLGKSLADTNFLNASISEFRVYGAALDPTEMSASFTAGPDALGGGGSADDNHNGIPDECEP